MTCGIDLGCYVAGWFSPLVAFWQAWDWLCWFVAGLIIGNAGVAHAMSETTRDYLHKFWDLIDDILNTVLFLLIGLEAVTVPRDAGLIMLGGGAIALSLLAHQIVR